jgi:hypothetical protein
MVGRVANIVMLRQGETRIRVRTSQARFPSKSRSVTNLKRELKIDLGITAIPSPDLVILPIKPVTSSTACG